MASEISLRNRQNKNHPEHAQIAILGGGFQTNAFASVDRSNMEPIIHADSPVLRDESENSHETSSDRKIDPPEFRDDFSHLCPMRHKTGFWIRVFWFLESSCNSYYITSFVKPSINILTIVHANWDCVVIHTVKNLQVTIQVGNQTTIV